MMGLKSVQEAIVLKAPPTEQSVERVHGLAGWDRFCLWAVDIRGAFLGYNGLVLRQYNVLVNKSLR